MSIRDAVSINMSSLGTASGKRLLAARARVRHNANSEQSKLCSDDDGEGEERKKKLDRLEKRFEEEFQFND